MRRAVVALLVILGLAGAAAMGWIAAMSRHADAPQVSAAPTLYRCPMHPHIVSDKPGHCPICNMTLVPIADSESAGPSTVSLDDARRTLVGARTVAVEEAPFVRRLRTVGRVAFDETRMKHVHTKVQGWIEHLHAGAEGDSVHFGDPLLTIYSPELLASQQEYLVALDNRARAAASSIPGVAEDADHLLDSARKRLLLQDMTGEQIDRLEQTRHADRIVTIYSPVAGTITARRVSHGERVESATSLLDIADLSTVWVLADLYESDLPFVHDGQEAEITVAASPGRTYRSRIRLLSPLVDPATRTVSARLEVPNPDLVLKPGMFTEVTLASDLGKRPSIPKDAVIRTGTRDVVFVTTDDRTFAPVEVRLGVELPDRWEIVSGLATGERVLVGANFLVDSESKLRSAQGGRP